MLVLSRDCFVQISAFCEAGYPDEVCGFLMGQINGKIKIIQTVLPVTNAALNRRNCFAISPRESYEAEQMARQNGQSVLGVFHSHPDAPAFPSPTDRAAAWALYSYLIAPVRNGRVGESASWILANDDGAMKEETLCLE